MIRHQFRHTRIAETREFERGGRDRGSSFALYRFERGGRVAREMISTKISVGRFENGQN